MQGHNYVGVFVHTSCCVASNNHLDQIRSETSVVQPKSMTTTLGLLLNIISLASFPSSSCLVPMILCSFD